MEFNFGTLILVIFVVLFIVIGSILRGSMVSAIMFLLAEPFILALIVQINDSEMTAKSLPILGLSALMLICAYGAWISYQSYKGDSEE